MIYEDPLTMQKPEGKARLIKKIGHSILAQHWFVHFIADEDPDEKVSRWIKKKKETT